ncbi:MAG: hypothetical protein KDB14_27465 [Planctomycetales bacterium]|nr:hypothetical protein [Planctomycetales bacterium]
MQRSWIPHWPTVVFGAFVLAGLLSAQVNDYGHLKHFPGLMWAGGRHGWPFSWYYSVNAREFGFDAIMAIKAVNILAWRFIADIAIAAVLLLGATYCIEVNCRRACLDSRVSLRGMFAFMGGVGLLGAYLRQVIVSYPIEVEAVGEPMFSVYWGMCELFVFIAVPMTCYAFIDVISPVTRRRKSD